MLELWEKFCNPPFSFYNCENSKPEREDNLTKVPSKVVAYGFGFVWDKQRLWLCPARCYQVGKACDNQTKAPMYSCWGPPCGHSYLQKDSLQCGRWISSKLWIRELFITSTSLFNIFSLPLVPSPLPPPRSYWLVAFELPRKTSYSLLPRTYLCPTRNYAWISLPLPYLHAYLECVSHDWGNWLSWYLVEYLLIKKHLGCWSTGCASSEQSTHSRMEQSVCVKVGYQAK